MEKESHGRVERRWSDHAVLGMGVFVSYPSLEESRNAELVPGEHLWILHKDIVSCRWCGICKSRRGNKPCKGIVRVKLR